MNKNFNVKLEEEFGKYNLSVTHNGYQWTSLRINDPDREIPLIVKALLGTHYKLGLEIDKEIT